MTRRCHEYNTFAQLCLRVSATTSLITAAATQTHRFSGARFTFHCVRIKSALFFFPRIQPLPVFLIRECLLAGYQREHAEKERACAIQRPTPRSLLPHSSTELREPDAAVSRDPDHIRDRARVFMSYTGRVRGF